MTDDIAITPMNDVHIAEVCAIEGDLFDTPWTEEMFRQEVQDNYLARPFVAVSAGEVVGYIIPWFLREGVHLLNIAVVRGLQRRGLARRMLAHLIALARDGGRELISLEVRADNAAALSLYESCRFKEVGLRRNYYQESGEDAVVMVLRLEDVDAEAVG
jgi:ribosomal-protein-alanine N-acetyltransferase